MAFLFVRWFVYFSDLYSNAIFLVDTTLANLIIIANLATCQLFLLPLSFLKFLLNIYHYITYCLFHLFAAAAAKSLQSSTTL